MARISYENWSLLWDKDEPLYWFDGKLTSIMGTNLPTGSMLLVAKPKKYIDIRLVVGTIFSDPYFTILWKDCDFVPEEKGLVTMENSLKEFLDKQIREYLKEK